MKHGAKKILTLILGAVMAGSIFALSACSHTHTAGKEWKSDATSHWHVCTEDGEVLDKADHTWNDGTVTKEASYIAEGEKTYTCTVCSATKKEKIAQRSLTGKTVMTSTNAVGLMDANADTVTMTTDKAIGIMDGQDEDGNPTKVDAPATVTFNVDLTTMQATLKIDFVLYDGAYIFTIVDVEQGDMTLGIGKAVVAAGTTEGSYTATFGSGDSAYTINFNMTTADNVNTYSAEIDMQGILKETATVTGIGTAKAYKVDTPAEVTFTVDWSKNEATLKIDFILFGGAYIFTIVDVEQGDMTLGIGKAVVTAGTTEGGYTATFGSDDSAYKVDFTVAADGICTANIAMEGILKTAAAMTSAVTAE